MTYFGLHNFIGAGVLFVLLYAGYYRFGGKKHLPPVVIGASTVPLLGVAAIDLTVGFQAAFSQAFEPAVKAISRSFGDRAVARFRYQDILRVAVALPVLMWASYTDLKSRIVRDDVWFPMMFYGIAFLLYDFSTGSWLVQSPQVAGSILFALVIAFSMFHLDLFGGADVKALIGVSLLFPTYPALISFPLHLPAVLDPPASALNMFSLSILVNTAAVAALYPIFLFARNVLRARDFSPIPLLFTARQVRLDESLDMHGKILPLWKFQSGNLFGWPLALFRSARYGFDVKFLQEYVEWHTKNVDSSVETLADVDDLRVGYFLDSPANTEEDGERRWDTDREEEAVEAMNELLSRDVVWMTPGTPFIIPMYAGLLIALTFGDISWWLVTALA